MPVSPRRREDDVHGTSRADVREQRATPSRAEGARLMRHDRLRRPPRRGRHNVQAVPRSAAEVLPPACRHEEVGMTALRTIAVAIVAVWAIALPCWAVICLG